MFGWIWVIWEWILWFFAPPRSVVDTGEPRRRLEQPEKPPASTLAADVALLRHLQEHGTCPDCGGNDWRGGPSGGACRNILCAKCFAEFNVGPLYAKRLAVSGKGRRHVYGL